MMSYFFWGTIILFISTLIFYVVFLSLMYYWHEKQITFVVAPLLFAFDFFLIAFLVMAIIVIFLQYLPDIIEIVR